MTFWMLTLERNRYVIKIKDYMYELTPEGKNVLDEIGKVKLVDSTPTVLAASNAPIQSKPEDYVLLHKTLQDKLVELTGLKQARGYSNAVFIPSVKDLQYYLTMFRRRYPELWDVDRITKCLVSHVEMCVKAGVYTPVIKYYIYKEEKGSPLAADLEAYQENADTQHKIKKTKDLFG